MLGGLAGLVGISCCVTPTVLALLGLSSVAFALSLGTTLYEQYGWHFRGVAGVLAVIGVLGLLRRRRACTLRGAAGHWRLIVTVAVSAIAVYGALYGVTTWLARLASV